MKEKKFKGKITLFFIIVFLILGVLTVMLLTNASSPFSKEGKKISHYKELMKNGEIMKEYLNNSPPNRSSSYLYLEDNAYQMAIKEIEKYFLTKAGAAIPTALLVLEKKAGPTEAAKTFRQLLADHIDTIASAIIYNLQKTEGLLLAHEIETKIDAIIAFMPQNTKQSLLFDPEEDLNRGVADYFIIKSCLPEDKFIELMASRADTHLADLHRTDIYQDEGYTNFLTNCLSDSLLKKIATKIKNVNFIIDFELSSFIDEERRIFFVSKQGLLSEKLEMINYLDIPYSRFNYASLVNGRNIDVQTMNMLIRMNFITETEGVKILEKGPTDVLFSRQRLNWPINQKRRYSIIINSIKSIKDYKAAMNYFNREKEFCLLADDLITALKVKYPNFEIQRLTNT